MVKCTFCLIIYCLFFHDFRSTIRITFENVSQIPVDFLHLAFDDSTIAPAQQALANGVLSVFETYETEYSLIHTPMFSWDKNEAKDILPGQRLSVTVQCYGKVGWQANSYVVQVFFLNCLSARVVRSTRLTLMHAVPRKRNSRFFIRDSCRILS